MAKKKYSDEEHVFPKILKKLIAEHDITYGELGERIGVRQQTISLYASGQTFPTIYAAERIARQFNVSIDYLVKGTSFENETAHSRTGLSEEAINMLCEYKDTPVRDFLDKALADGTGCSLIQKILERGEKLKDAINNHEDIEPSRWDVWHKETVRYELWQYCILLLDFVNVLGKESGIDLMECISQTF